MILLNVMFPELRASLGEVAQLTTRDLNQPSPEQAAIYLHSTMLT